MQMYNEGPSRDPMNAIRYAKIQGARTRCEAKEDEKGLGVECEE